MQTGYCALSTTANMLEATPCMIQSSKGRRQHLAAHKVLCQRHYDRGSLRALFNRQTIPLKGLPLPDSSAEAPLDLCVMDSPSMGAECPFVLGGLAAAAVCAASCCALLAGTIFTATFCPAAPSANCTGASAP